MFRHYTVDYYQIIVKLLISTQFDVILINKMVNYNWDFHRCSSIRGLSLLIRYKISHPKVHLHSRTLRDWLSLNGSLQYNRNLCYKKNKHWLITNVHYVNWHDNKIAHMYAEQLFAPTLTLDQRLLGWNLHDYVYMY